MAVGLSGCSGAPEQPVAIEPTDIVLASAPAAPISIELFTSQSCSSCPPADRLVGELVDDPNLVIISRPVTYWDRLGWRDTLAREENTQLQRHYADTLSRGGGRSYTPQAVVGGRIGLVGSRRGELEAAITEVGEDASDISVDVTGDADNGFRVSLSGPANREAIVRLLALDSSETVSIGRGENGGRSVTYTNILRAEQDLARYSGGSLDIEIGRGLVSVDGSDRYAIIVRSETGGPILAARYLGS
ncbi:DUF1223 domain-containing protein [Parasphingopyxis sp. CP4]|uniref:DUF1223 domain-containing protein n=1 Tax=Parasphingopyxis sp. CP4 TaxID=2724527 RepID=UPI00159FCEAF|nr:DUF1223 domain-containing protein [Parasphingopyxis sp. CP4]QLC21376.1 DUF1223 domain-containing protein [Parasphingopyxis sp. CP4]